MFGRDERDQADTNDRQNSRLPPVHCVFQRELRALLNRAVQRTLLRPAWVSRRCETARNSFWDPRIGLRL